MKFGSYHYSSLTLLSLLNSSAYTAAFIPTFGLSTSSTTTKNAQHADVSTFATAFGLTNKMNVSQLRMSIIDASNSNNDDFEDDEEEEDDEEDEKSIYEEFATSEFTTDEPSPSTSSDLTNYFSEPQKPTDWGGEYDTLRSRVDDANKGLVGPSRALFRTMTAESPNDAIRNFVTDASPEVVSAMSSAVTSLLGGLTSPGAGLETIVKANGEKLGALCFQLQMTGYMFRNAEYVLAIRDLMNIRGSASLEDYKKAFNKLDADGSGYIESGEIETLLSEVCEDDELPAYEVETFLKFFDSNNDGRISWEEFERGLGLAAEKKMKQSKNGRADSPFALAGSEDEDDEDDFIEADLGEPTVSGKIQIEMDNGKMIEVEASEYIDELKREAEALKSALSRERRGPGASRALNEPPNPMDMGPGMGDGSDRSTGIASYISSLQGDIKSLTKGISPEVVDAMKMLVEFVLDGNTAPNRAKEKVPVNELEMEIPGSALQHLALWQLVLGYKLREEEATGAYKKMLE